MQTLYYTLREYSKSSMEYDYSPWQILNGIFKNHYFISGSKEAKNTVYPLAWHIN